MSVTRPSVKLKRLRRRFGISAPKLAIRQHVAWYWRALTVVAVLFALVISAVWIFDVGRRTGGFHRDESDREIQSLRGHLVDLDTELARLRSVVGSGESNLQIERATQKQLLQQVRALEMENAALKEDLAFFEGLIPTSDAAGEGGGLRIERFRIEPTGTPGEFRYRMLVVNSASRPLKEPKLWLQLVVKVRQDGKDAIITVPDKTESKKENFRFEIKHFQRLEGIVLVPVGASVTGVEARVLQDETIRAKQSLAF
ncbi:DUF6776 family protein [Propionivibrio soli]|uniref:DUF6776 family protein n=1 Tax=Propionivibrio soli TaxID=2976531 RepID=UPI0021E847D3|nr:DUF6776 family protein [Propionivibrio soli]